jgi:hypothetical protein
MQRGGPGSEGFGFEHIPIRRPLPSAPESKQTEQTEPIPRLNEIIALLSQIAASLTPVQRTLIYDISTSIGTALDSTGNVSVANNALRTDDSRYIRERIFDRIGTLAPKINIICNGPGTLYVRVSYEGQQFSDEIAVLEGEKKPYENVYEFRVRSDTLGLNYQVSEQDIWPQTAVSKAEKIEIYSTNKDTDFTGAIVMNDHQKLNLTGLLSNRYMVRGVNIQSIQPLKYRLIFWSSSAFDNVDLNLDTYIDDVELDMSSSPAFRINNAGQYYLNVGDLSIIYEDFDITRTLHISLQNESAVAKNALAAGAVQLDIKISPRL